MLTKVLILCVVIIAVTYRIQGEGACDSNPCMDGYDCVSHITGDYTCRCGPNVKNCQHSVGKRLTTTTRCLFQHSECSSQQVCVMKTANCTKDHCQRVAACVDKADDGCKDQPCLHKGTCVHDSEHGNHCACPVGFYGAHCEILII